MNVEDSSLTELTLHNTHAGHKNSSRVNKQNRIKTKNATGCS